jgi:hypothetical protein
LVQDHVLADDSIFSCREADSLGRSTGGAPARRMGNVSMLDFSEISEDGTQFELLIREILFSLNYHVIWSGVGADGGRDLLVREELQSIFGRRFFTWLVQCKHFAKSKRSVGVKDLDNVVDSCVQHCADGYLLVSSTYVSSAVVNRLEAINADRSKHLATNFWDCTILERLLSTPDNWGIAQRFTPVSSHAQNWQLSRTTQPNSWVVNYRGHHIILNNRIGSSNLQLPFFDQKSR